VVVIITTTTTTIIIIIIIILLLLLLLLLLLFTAIEFSLGGSGPYSSTDKTKKNKIYINETIQNTVNTSTHITKTPTLLTKHPHITKHTSTHFKRS
jgi:flagellar basal body-associated protein FliL